MEAIVEILRKLQEKKEDTVKWEDVEVCCTVGISPFHVLTALNMHRELKTILEKDDMKRRNIDEKSKMEGDTALHIAVLSDNPEMIEVLIKAGADCNIKNDRGQTPFILAIAKGKANLMNELLKYKEKFDINESDKSGNTALHFATEQKWSSCIEQLLTVGAKWDVVNNEDQTPLTIAASKGDIKSVMLLAKKTKVDQVTQVDFIMPAISCAVSKRQKETTLFLMSRLNSDCIDAVVASLADNIRTDITMIKHNKTFETVMDSITLTFWACVQCENAKKSLLKHKMVSTWISVLNRFSGVGNSCELVFVCICKLMLDADVPDSPAHDFVQEFIDCKGPDITVDFLQSFMEYRRQDMVIGTFFMLLPLCKVKWGRKWLRKNYHRIVESYQFFDTLTGFSDSSIPEEKLKVTWKDFKKTFDEIQATESKRHEAELLAEEEIEKAKREKKNDRKKKRDQKKAQNDKTKGMSSSPNTSVEESQEGQIEEAAANKSPEMKTELANSGANKETSDKVTSTKESKLNRKKPKVTASETVESDIPTTKPQKSSPDRDNVFLNFRPNRGKPPGFKCKETTVKPSDLPWRETKKDEEVCKSPGKEFPKLCKEKFANMLLQLEEENKKTHQETKQAKKKDSGKDMFKFNDKNNIKKYLSPKKHHNTVDISLSPAKKNCGKSGRDTTMESVCSPKNEHQEKDSMFLTEPTEKLKRGPLTDESLTDGERNFKSKTKPSYESRNNKDQENEAKKKKEPERGTMTSELLNDNAKNCDNATRPSAFSKHKVNPENEAEIIEKTKEPETDTITGGNGKNTVSGISSKNHWDLETDEKITEKVKEPEMATFSDENLNDSRRESDCEKATAARPCTRKSENFEEETRSLKERIQKVKELEKDTVAEEKNFNEIFGAKRQLFEKWEMTPEISGTDICNIEDDKCETREAENSPTDLSPTRDIVPVPSSKCNLLEIMVMNDVRACCSNMKNKEESLEEDSGQKISEEPKDTKGAVLLDYIKTGKLNERQDNINSSSAATKYNLKSIWDISPVKEEDVVDPPMPSFVIPIEPVSPASKANKKRSRATFIAPREPFKMSPGDVITLDAARKNEENNKRSRMEIFQLNTDYRFGEIQPKETSEEMETETVGTESVCNDPATTALGNKQFEFLSESRLKSSGSIKSDISEPKQDAMDNSIAVDVTEIQFGYFSSGYSPNPSDAKKDSKSQSDENFQSVKKSNVDLRDFDLPPLEHLTDLNSRTRPHSDLKLPSKSFIPENESRKPLYSRTAPPNIAHQSWQPPCTFQSKFGAVGEPCPVSFFNPEFQQKGFCSKREKDVTDHSKLKLGDGDRLLDDDEPREVFGARSYWKEPSHYGYGWLNGLSQAVLAQNDLVNTDSMDKVLQKYPLFNQGIDYETYKRRKLEEQWDNNQIFPKYDMWSCGEPVQLDWKEATSLLPQNLLESPQEISDMLNKETLPQETEVQQPQQKPHGLEKVISKDKNLLPVLQLSNFQTGDIGFPQPGISVIGNPQASHEVPSQGQMPAFNTEPLQTGQGDPYFYNNVYPKMMANANSSKNVAIPYLSSASAILEAAKADPLQVRMTPEYLSEPSDKSSLSSATISTINSFKSANELIFSRSDISINHERLGESFVIGKGKFGTTIYEGWTGDGMLVAIRRMKLEEFNKRQRQLGMFIWNKLSHRNICDILELKRGDHYGFVVMERFKENLKHFITRTRAQGYHPLQHLISMCRGLVHGLAFLHKQNIHHGRLCPENILLGPNDAVKLSDYGLPVVDRPVYHKTEFPDDPKSIWLCSESLECAENMTIRDRIFKADVQVSAMLIYYTLTLGDHPFGRCPEEVLENLAHGPACMRQLGEEFDDVLPKMLTVRPDQRLCIEQVKLHPFLWTDSEKFRFLVNVGHHLYRSKESKNEVSATLERCINDLSPTSAGKQSWVSFTQTSLVQEITGLLPWIGFRYNVGGLLSFMEAVDTYQHLLSASSRKILGGHPEVYFLTRFPALPIRVHQLVRVLERQLPVFLYPTIDC